jgi:hypothetical protein
MSMSGAYIQFKILVRKYIVYRLKTTKIDKSDEKIMVAENIERKNYKLLP